MIIVSGWIRVSASDRAAYLDSCREVVEAARMAPGCLDFAISADLVDAERINVVEQWASVEDVERFRGSGPSDDQQAAVLGAQVVQHEISASTPLT